jgi:hypothetical protein
MARGVGAVGFDGAVDLDLVVDLRLPAWAVSARSFDPSESFQCRLVSTDLCNISDALGLGSLCTLIGSW